MVTLNTISFTACPLAGRGCHGRGRSASEIGADALPEKAFFTCKFQRKTLQGKEFEEVTIWHGGLNL